MKNKRIIVEKLWRVPAWDFHSWKPWQEFYFTIYDDSYQFQLMIYGIFIITSYELRIRASGSEAIHDRPLPRDPWSKGSSFWSEQYFQISNWGFVNEIKMKKMNFSFHLNSLIINVVESWMNEWNENIPKWFFTFSKNIFLVPESTKESADKSKGCKTWTMIYTMKHSLCNIVYVKNLK